ncbi:MAG: hypothetical protein IKV85_05045 [Ruminococcus sp.]|nr:hypothetical protein [Ruminococcus sp.]
MRKNLLENIDFDTAKKIADEYPALSKKDMDRMFSASMKKSKKLSVEGESREKIFNSAIAKAVDESFEDVQLLKIEKYKKPVISRYIGIAASLGIIVAGIATMGILLGRNSDMSDSSVIEPATQFTVELPTEAYTYSHDYKAVAYRITDEYFNMDRYIYTGGFEYKESNGLPPADSEIVIHYIKDGVDGVKSYYPVIDEKFPDMEAFKAYYYFYRKDGYTVNADMETYSDNIFGGNITDEDINSPETIGEKLYAEDGIFYEYININGKLYMLEYPIVEGIEGISKLKWVSEPVISDITEDSFTITRVFNSVEDTTMTDVTVAFEIVWDETAQDWRAASETITW